MAQIILVTGGSRSGKSRYAQSLAEASGSRCTFVATCPDIDDETHLRIRRHQQHRDPSCWQTVEEPLDLVRALADAPNQTLLVDCLTLWVNNLIYRTEDKNAPLTEEQMEIEASALLAAAKKRTGMVIMVTNEVGQGVVPASPLGRKFRDLAGRCNQVVAAGADTVTLLCCGYPLTVKG